MADEAAVMDAAPEAAESPTGAPAPETGSPEAAPEAVDDGSPWSSISNPDLRRWAGEGHKSVEELAARARESRQALSRAVVPPGPEATSDQIANYRERIGAHKDVEGYLGAFPPVPEDYEMADDESRVRGRIAETMLRNNVPAAAAQEMINAYFEEQYKSYENLQRAHEQALREAERQLRSEFPGDRYEQRRNLAQLGFEQAMEGSGGDAEQWLNMQTPDGRSYLLDNPHFIKAWAWVGEAFSSDALERPIDQGEADNLSSQLKNVRGLIEEAQESRDDKEANRLFEVEQQILAQLERRKTA